MTIPGGANALLLASTAEGDFKIERSLRFNDDDSASLSRTPSSQGNRKTWTWSGWLKRCQDTSLNQNFWSVRENNNNMHYIRFDTTGALRAELQVSGSKKYELITTAVFRDFSAWYHVVLVFDSTQSTASNRVKLYVNGTQITSFSTETYPSQNQDGLMNKTVAHYISDRGNGINYFDGYMAEINFVDGTALAPTDFGEYDDDNNWNPKEFSGTYGTNGFSLNFSDNSSKAALGADSSGNSNTWTVNNLQAAAGASSDALTAVSFDGVDDKLTLGTDSNLSLSGVFTLEAWIYRVGTNNEVGIFEGSAGGVGSCVVRVASNMLGLERHNTAFDILSSGTVPTDQWVHVAITRDSSNTCRAFINGTHDGTSTNNTYGYSGNFRVGQSNNGYWNSAVSNLRLIKGTCLYTSNFTPPTTPLANVANTVLLICQDGSSPTAATVKPSGTTIGTGGSPTAGSYPIVAAADVDSVIDTPTNYEASSGNNGGNYATLNSAALRVNGGTISNGSLRLFSDSNKYIESRSTIAASAFNNYSELTISTAASNSDVGFGVGDRDAWVITGGGSYLVYRESGLINRFPGNTSVANVASFTQGDVLGMAVDSTNVKFYKNGSLQGTYAHQLAGDYFVTLMNIANNDNTEIDVNFGQRPFVYTPPTGYKSLCTTNLPDPTIADGSTAMDVVTYSGDGTNGRAITTSHSPDLVWIKARNQSDGHNLFDTVRGTTKVIKSNNTNAELTESNSLTAFNSDGFTVGSNASNAQVNQNGFAYVAWSWDAGTSTANNTDGTITTSVRVSPTNGFSIATYTGNGNANQTLGHGLNAAPSFVLIKDRTSSQNWAVLHTSAGTLGTLDGGTNYKLLELNAGSAARDASYNTIWHPTSTTVKIGEGASSAHWTNKSGDNYLMLAWAPVEGYSAFGSYTGNGSADGPFVYTGFRVRYLLQKRTDSSGSWAIKDAAREPYNVVDTRLYADGANSDMQQTSFHEVDFLSNGFKVRSPGGGEDNANNATFVYAAFAEHPFKTARAR